MGEVELVLDERAALGEGPLWDDRAGRLWWVDIEGERLHRFDPATGGDEAFAIGQRVSTVVPCRTGGVMLGLQRGLGRFDPESGRLAVVADPEAGNPDVRFNDGKCDPVGRFWAGTMTFSRTTGGANLWRLDPDLSIRRMLAGVTTSNGLAWSLDGRTLYYIDSPTWRVDAFDYDLAGGTIVNRRPVIAVPEEMGKPDGMTIDAAGMLWVAHYRGGRVCRSESADGRLLQTVHLPVSHTTACALGGPDLDELYVTSARDGLAPEELTRQPHAGGLFRVRVTVPGLPAFAFDG